MTFDRSPCSATALVGSAAAAGRSLVLHRPRQARPPLRRWLLHSASITALVVAGSAPARAGGFRSLSQALSATPQNVAAAATAGGANAAKQANLGAQNLAAAAAKFRSLDAALTAAAGSYTGAAVPDGTAAGGLVQAPGVAGASNAGTLWSGANTTLGTATSGGVTSITVTQTSALASLTWQTFNIGAHTKLVFNQSAGGTLASSWIAINTVQDPNENPSVILGEISAPGKVYILNTNGILFGAGSQVNVGALVATTAVIAQAQYTRNANGQITGFNLYGSSTGTSASSSYTPTFTDTPDGSAVTSASTLYTPGNITVQAGASITTPTPSSSAVNAGGYVILLGGTVTNDGEISTPRGQTILGAGDRFALQAGYSSTGNTLATVIGSSIDTTLTGANASGIVTNAGVIGAEQGDITLLGHSVNQDGVIISTTTVNNRGTVHLLTPTDDTTGSVTLGAGSVTEILPQDDGSTALESQRESNLSLSGTYNAQRLLLVSSDVHLDTANTLTDTLGESRIEISTGGTITAQPGALALAQGGQIALGAGGAVLLETGSTLDVSGVNTSVAASYNNLQIPSIVPYYERDSAGNRVAGGIEFDNVYLDQRFLTDVSNGGTVYTYTQGGLLEVSGNLGLINTTIGEWAAIGGQVELQAGGATSATSGNGTVVVAPGATINLTGGTVTYQAGPVQQSYVISTNGQIYNINDAPGDLVYQGVYTGDVENHPRWHLSTTYVNPLLTPSQIMESAYTIGRDAGSLTVSAGTAVLDGTVAAGVTVGQTQSSARPGVLPGTPPDSFLLAQNVVPLAGTLDVGDYASGAISTPFQSNILLAPGNAPSGTLTVLPDSVAGTVAIASDALNAAGFANISLSTAGSINVNGALTAADGGTITLSGQNIAVASSITARSGGITLTTLQSDAIPAGTLTAASINISSGVTLNASGAWTNLTASPGASNAGGYANGGSVSIVSAGSAVAAAGSTIDVSGGGLLVGTKLTAGNGGSINFSADIQPGLVATEAPAAPVSLGSTLLGLAAGAGGTLSITAPSITIGNAIGGAPAAPGVATLQFAPSLFSLGFAAYDLTGFLGVTVPDNTALAVTRPVAALVNAAPTGAALSSVFSAVLPSLYTQPKGADALTQRAGASVVLSSSVLPSDPLGGGGTLSIGQGSSITVDPGKSIQLDAYGQITVLGTLTAHGGTITVANTRYSPDESGAAAGSQPSNYVDGLSVWLGGNSVLDASGLGVVQTDGLGRSFGLAQAGGTILLGGLAGLTVDSLESTYAQVIERPGAVINASGGAATVDVQQGLESNQVVALAQPVTLVGNGGTIAARSYDGIALDGTVLARAGGAGAAGGNLLLRLDGQNDTAYDDLPPDYPTPQQIIVSQSMVAEQTAPGLAPGSSTDPSTLNIARISQAQINAGGFDSVSLAAPDGILLDGALTLQVNRSLTLETGLLGDTKANVSASIRAPYVLFTQYPSAGSDPNANGVQLTGAAASGTLTVNAGLIDFAGNVAFGGARTVISGGAQALAYGFGLTAFESTGDIRFSGGGLGSPVAIGSSGNLLFQGAQLFPTTEADVAVYAGDNPNASATQNQFAGGTITVLGLGGAAPAVPYSVGGTLALVSETVVQDGVVRAPFGTIRLGSDGGNDGFSGATAALSPSVTNSVTLGDASITSVSLGGLTVPFGGTVDGVNYLYNGSAVNAITPLLQIDSAAFTALHGSTIDISGGGTLAGAAFVFGRGGSADVNKYPLLNSASGTVTAGSGSDQIYAILPGYGASEAPSAPADTAYKVPGIGEQITLAAGEVPGLAAGTYTLLPAYYDLLPGAYRVELTGAADTSGPGVSFGNFTTVAGVRVGYAGTDILAQVPQAALFTSTAGVNQLAQYDQENYSTFEINTNATFNAPRPFLPQDAATLSIVLNAPTTGIAANDQPVSIDAAALVQAPASGGYGATIEISGSVPIEVLANSSQMVAPVTLGSGAQATLVNGIGLQASALDALDAARLVIGGTLTGFSTVPNEIGVIGSVPYVSVLPGADLTAADIMLTGASNAVISVGSGATLSTLGRTAALQGLSTGYYFSTDDAGNAFPVLGLSSLQLVFVPNADPASGASISVADNAALLAGGSLNFVAPHGTSVAIGQAQLGGKYVNLQVANINIGTTAELALLGSRLPSGLALDSAALATLVDGDTALGVPAATQLNLTATQAVNILGSVSLNSGATDLNIYSPAIYGYGLPGNATPQIVTKGTATGTALALQAAYTTSTSFTATAPILQGGVVLFGTGATVAAGTQFAAGDVFDAGTVLPDTVQAQFAGDSVVIKAPGFVWGGVATSLVPLNTGDGASVISATPGAQIYGSVAHVAASLLVEANTITIGNGPQTQPDDQATLDHALIGFSSVTLDASQKITANAQQALSVYATQTNQAGFPVSLTSPGTGGNVTLQAPLIATAPGAVLSVTAGGTIDATSGIILSPGNPPAHAPTADTASVTALGGQINLTAADVTLDTAIALPSGRLDVVSGSNIDLTAYSDIDLSGRATGIFDQTVYSNGGTLSLQAYAPAATLGGGTGGGNITQDTLTTASGSVIRGTINVSAPAHGTATAGEIDLTALSGTVSLDGVLLGSDSTGSGAGSGGSFYLAAGTLGGGGFDGLNASLDAGGLHNTRSFELATGNLTVDGTVNARNVSISADSGTLNVTGTINASGTGPGTIALSAGADLVLAATAVLDAHATSTAYDSYGEPIDAENRAQVTLSSTGGTVVLTPGAAVNVSYPGAASASIAAGVTAADQFTLGSAYTVSTGFTATAAILQGGTVLVPAGGTVAAGTVFAAGDVFQAGSKLPDAVQTAADPLGQITIDAPRTSGGIALSAPGALDITGAATISAFGFKTYSPTDQNGTVVQDNGGGATGAAANAGGTLGLVQINADSQAWMASLETGAGTATSLAGTLGAQLAGLTAYGSAFNLAPGVNITSSVASHGNLTIAGDLDFSGFRYSDPAGFGLATSGTVGSGEAGSVAFRAANDLVVNGSVTDGFAPPPDTALTGKQVLAGDANGWEYLVKINRNTGNGVPTTDPLNADILLPSTTTGVSGLGTTTQIILAPGTVFQTDRPISLNYAIQIDPAPVRANTVIPFLFDSTKAITVPAGGFTATAPIFYNGVAIYYKGSFIPGGTVLARGDTYAAGTVLPVGVTVRAKTVVPAGTDLQIFGTANGSVAVTLALATGALPDNALIPAATDAVFEGVFNGQTAYLSALQYRPANAQGVQGYTYALAALLPAGSQSWNMDFTAGANLAAASASAVAPTATLAGGVGVTMPNTINQDPGSLILADAHYFSEYTTPLSSTTTPTPAFSVIRTGTGALSLNAGGSIDQSSLYGIYTAGTQVPLGGGADAQFNTPVQPQIIDQINTISFPTTGTPLGAIVLATYQANYTNGGGNVSLTAGGDVTGDIFAPDTSFVVGAGATASDSIGNWLWRQGSAQLGQPTSWWINFGTAVAPLNISGVDLQNTLGAPPILTGFEGLGALGGGDVTVRIGGNAGQSTARDASMASYVSQAQRGEGLVIAIGGTGRLLDGASAPITTGGGSLTLDIAGTLNGLDTSSYGKDGAGAQGGAASPMTDTPDINGVLVNLRGNITVQAGAVGQIDPQYNFSNSQFDPRAADPFTANNGVQNGGITLAPGDGSVTISTQRDLVVAGAADPGRVFEQYASAVTLPAADSALQNFGGQTGFTLWQPSTAISLLSAGGNVTPTTLPEQSAAGLTVGYFFNSAPTDYRSIYPATLLVSAPSGSIIYGLENTAPTGGGYPFVNFSLETMPAPTGQVAFLAGQSIYANSYSIDISGADPAGLATPASPNFSTNFGQAGGVQNLRTGGGSNQSVDALFGQEADTPTTNLHAADTQPALFYALAGDIVNFQTGETLNFATALGEQQPQWYIAAKPVQVEAGNDIVSSGTRPSAYPGASVFNTQENQASDLAYASGVYTSGNLVLNNTSTSLSVFEAGRDILSSYLYVGGPGTAVISAGRNIYEASYSVGSGEAARQVLFFGAFKSLGDNLISGSPLSTTSGASLDVLAGIGAGADYSAFANLYFNAANQANLNLDITDPANAGKVQQTYAPELLAWLQANQGYTGTQAGALAYFDALSTQTQGLFVRQVFFEELAASGTEETDKASRFFGSYARGRQAIDTLFPGVNGQTSTNGVPAGYTGGITMFSGTVGGVTNANGASVIFDGGIATLFGGGVQVLAPGGNVLLGTPEPAPGNSSGIVTFGSGDVNIFSLGSVLLGQSRIFTTAGGNITIWSAQGDINAGVAVQTSITYDPPLLVYDNSGGITETPPASVSGGGIATLQPLPQVPAGNVSLIAPLGTIDAGEAGIRVSGNLVLAAARISGAANISVKGSSAGIPTVTSTSLGESEAAGAASGASTAAAQSEANRKTQQEAASVLEVEVVSIGGTYEEEQKKKRKAQ